MVHRTLFETCCQFVHSVMETRRAGIQMSSPKLHSAPLRSLILDVWFVILPINVSKTTSKGKVRHVTSCLFGLTDYQPGYSAFSFFCSNLMKF